MVRGVVVGALIAAIPARAHAGACPGARLDVLPQDGATAVPTNVQPRIVLEADVVEVLELADRVTRRIVRSGSAKASELELRLRDQTGATVPVELRRIAANHPVVIARPKADLAAHTEYAVVVHTASDDYAVAHFTTGDARDTTEPSLDKVGKPQLFTWQPSKPPHWKDAYGSFAEIEVTGLAGAAGFELHELGADAAASDSTLRAVLFASERAKLRFGSTSACVGASVEIPARPTGKQATQWHLWLRAFDLAGNVTPLREMTIDLTRRKPAR